jgi:hypothetical protein
MAEGPQSIRILPELRAGHHRDTVGADRRGRPGAGVRGRSLPRRLDQLAARGHAGDRERLIFDVAAKTGLDPAEVRAKLELIEAHERRYGPSTVEQTVRRIANELGLSEAEVWAEYAQVTGRAVPR